MRSGLRSGTGVVLVCAALTTLAVMLWRASGNEADPGHAPEPGSGGSDPGSGTTADVSAVSAPASGAGDNARRARPNVVTRAGGRYVWELDEPARQAFLADLRALADAGWGEAVTVLAPVVVDCIDHPPESEATLRRLVYGPMLQFTVGEDGEIRKGAPPEPDPEAAQAARDERFRELMSDNREKQITCNDAMPENPDRLMDWLEQALAQQPEGFIDAVLSGRLMPEDSAWIVRNAERLARFNLRLVAAIESRVLQGDPEALRQAWRVLARGNFTPEPQPLRAYPYALAASMLPAGTPGHIPGHSRTEEWVEHLLGRPLTERELSDASARARELHDHCCNASGG